MGMQSQLGLKDTQRFVKVSGAARALAPLLLMAAFVRCSAGELGSDAENPQAEPALGGEGLESRGDVGLAGEGELLEEGTEPQEEAELELGQLAQPLVDGAPCFPGTVACLNAGTAQRCVNGRVASLPCPANTSCSNGQCLASRVCTPNAALGCSGSSRVLCNAAGTGSTIVACPSGTTCAGTGQCVPLPRICVPGSRRCSGNTLQTCNAQGTAFVSTACNGFCTTSGCIVIR